MLPPPTGEMGWSIASTALTAGRAPPPGLADASVPPPFSPSLLIPALSLARSARFGGCHHHSAPRVLPPRVPRPPGSSCPRLSCRVWPHVSRLDYCLVAEPPVWSEASRSDLILTRSLSGDRLAPCGSADSILCEPVPCSPPDSSPESYLLPNRPARLPAPYASDTSPGVTPLSGPRLISVCIQPSPWARRSVGAVERGGSRFLRTDPPPWRGARVPARSPHRTSAPRA